MGESVEMGAREVGRTRTKDVALLRIDHSDVYIENERLGEDLVHTIDTIHRRRYQKVMSRDTEINELKQSLLTMRQRSSSSSSLKKSKSGSKVKNRNSTKKTAAFNGNSKNTERNRGGKMAGERRSTSTPPTQKSINVVLPRNNDSSDDSSDDEGGSDSDFSSSDDDDSVDDSEDGGNGETKRNGFFKSSNNNNNHSSRNVTSASTVSNRQFSKNNNNIRHGNENHTSNINLIKHTDPLSRIMSRLNLDKLPPSWYTQVVPASDIYVNKRIIGMDGSYSGGNNNSKQGVRFSKKSKSRKPGQTAAPKIRPSTTAGDIFRQDSSILPMQKEKSQINQIREQQRPFTTPAGVRYNTSVNGGGQRSRSRMGGVNNKSSDFVNADKSEDRSQSVLFCEQAAHGTKTMRQLKEEEMLSATMDSHNPIDYLLEEVRRERKVIDEKVKRFVESLDEKKRTERLKKLMSETNLIKPRSSLQIS